MNFKAFAKNDRGAIAIVFGFALLLIALFIGAAVDTGRAFSAASSVTALLDAAALAASKEMAEQELSKADAEEFARNYFMRTLTAATIRGVGFEGVHAEADPATGMVKLDINFEVTTTFARAANVKTLRMHRSSTAALNLKRIELAMVLDITGSMNGQKIADLKLAAKDLVGIMLPDNKVATNRIAVVPYSELSTLAATPPKCRTRFRPTIVCSSETVQTRLPTQRLHPAAISARSPIQRPLQIRSMSAQTVVYCR